MHGKMCSCHTNKSGIILDVCSISDERIYKMINILFATYVINVLFQTCNITLRKFMRFARHKERVCGVEGLVQNINIIRNTGDNPMKFANKQSMNKPININICICDTNRISRNKYYKKQVWNFQNSNQDVLRPQITDINKSIDKIMRINLSTHVLNIILHIHFYVRAFLPNLHM